MFKSILIPTDGSTLSDNALKMGFSMAKETNAKITVIHVTPEYHIAAIEGFIPPPELEDEYKAAIQSQAAAALTAVATKADKAGITCDTVHRSSDHPHQAIIKVAEEKHCDLIVMASHGRRGLTGLLLGSETSKVLTHTKIPVLVVR